MRALPGLTFSGLALALSLTACSNDGRDMRPPLESQTESVIAPTDTAAFTVDSVEEPMSMTLYGPWLEGESIPAEYTCEGSWPSLSWIGVPEGTESLALIVLDTTDTSVDAVGRAHWVMHDIAPSVISIDAGVLPTGAIVAANAFGTPEAPELAWRAPCPPAGEMHTYVFEIHALDQSIELPPETPAGDMIRAIDFATIATASLSGSVLAI